MFYERREDILAKIKSLLYVIDLYYQEMVTHKTNQKRRAARQKEPSYVPGTATCHPADQPSH